MVRKGRDGGRGGGREIGEVRGREGKGQQFYNQHQVPRHALNSYPLKRDLQSAILVDYHNILH